MDVNKESLNENPFSSQRTWIKSHSDALTIWLQAKRSSITKNALLVTVGCDGLSQQDKTSDRKGEKMYAVTNRRYFRCHECPCTCFRRAWGPSCLYCHFKGDCQVSHSLVRSGLLRSTGGNYHAYVSSCSSRHMIANQDAHAFDLRCSNRLMLAMP